MISNHRTFPEGMEPPNNENLAPTSAINAAGKGSGNGRSISTSMNMNNNTSKTPYYQHYSSSSAFKKVAATANTRRDRRVAFGDISNRKATNPSTTEFLAATSTIRKGKYQQQQQYTHTPAAAKSLPKVAHAVTRVEGVFHPSKSVPRLLNFAAAPAPTDKNTDGSTRHQQHPNDNNTVLAPTQLAEPSKKSAFMAYQFDPCDELDIERPAGHLWSQQNRETDLFDYGTDIDNEDVISLEGARTFRQEWSKVLRECQQDDIDAMDAQDRRCMQIVEAKGMELLLEYEYVPPATDDTGTHGTSDTLTPDFTEYRRRQAHRFYFATYRLVLSHLFYFLENRC